MAHKFEGADYKATASLSRQEIKKLIREEIKRYLASPAAAVKGAKLTACTSKNNSVNITVTVPEGAPYPHTAELRWKFEALRYAPEGLFETRISGRARQLLEDISEIANAYNFDDSDPQSDYFFCRFYLHARIEIEETAKQHTLAVFQDLCHEVGFDLNTRTDSYPNRVVEFLRAVNG